jgi:amidohydrolase
MTRQRRIAGLVFGLVSLAGLGWTPAFAASNDPVAAKASELLAKVIAWRRDFHEHPELSGREERTSQIVAAHLRSLGLEVRDHVGGYGVVGLLRGAKPGKVVALRADMDALPVTEDVDLPFKSVIKAMVKGREVGVMHACGHDSHTAIQMGVASLLAGMRDQIAGTIVFIFQPAEEGVPDGEPGKLYGARAMIADGALDNPKVEAIFGLHAASEMPAGTISYISGPALASSDAYQVLVEGKSSHGGYPWQGIDPIVVSAQIIMGFQTIISRQSDIGKEPAVLTVGSVQAGNRNNIIPERAMMEGTLRTFDEAMRADIKRRMVLTATKIAEASEAKASINFEPNANGVTVNNPALTAKMLPSLERAAPGQVVLKEKQTAAEDFSAFAAKVPGLFISLGVQPDDKTKTAPHHSSKFLLNDKALDVGVRTMSQLALDYLAS